MIGERERKLGRTVLGVGAWVSTLTGLAMLTGRVVVPVLVTIAVGAGIAVARAVAFVRGRLERLRSWPRPGDVEHPVGPRRVPLLETGLAGPDLG